MNEEKAEAIMNASKEQFKQVGFSEIDVDMGLVLMTALLETFESGHWTLEITKGIKIASAWPINSKKFPEILRVLANVLELTNEIPKK